MSRVSVDYDKLSALLTERMISKPELAKAIRIPETTLKGSFIRKTRLSAEVAHRISIALMVPPEAFVLPADIEAFNIYKYLMKRSPDEEKIKAEEVAREFNVNSSINKYLESLNIEGLEKAASFLHVLAMVPEYRRTEPTIAEQTEAAADETSL